MEWQAGGDLSDEEGHPGELVGDDALELVDRPDGHPRDARWGRRGGKGGEATRCGAGLRFQGSQTLGTTTDGSHLRVSIYFFFSNLSSESRSTSGDALKKSVGKRQSPSVTSQCAGNSCLLGRHTKSPQAMNDLQHTCFEPQPQTPLGEVQIRIRVRAFHPSPFIGVLWDWLPQLVADMSNFGVCCLIEVISCN